MNKETLAIGLVLVFLGIVLGYVMLTFYKKQETSPEQPEEKPEVCPPFTSKFKGKPNVKTLGKVDLTAQVFLGDYGRSVLYLQKQLNEKHQAVLDEDGKFGCDTYFAVRKHLGLQPVDGINLMDV
jgi:hypothetical protein